MQSSTFSFFLAESVGAQEPSRSFWFEVGPSPQTKNDADDVLKMDAELDGIPEEVQLITPSAQPGCDDLQYKSEELESEENLFNI